MSSPNFALAREWIESRAGWGKFVAAEKLTKQTITWMAIYKNGELIVAQSRKRINWLFPDRTQSGVKTITFRYAKPKSVKIQTMANDSGDPLRITVVFIYVVMDVA